MIDVRAIRQEHIGKRALVLVLAVSLECHFLAKDQGCGRLFRLAAIGLAFLLAVDAVEAHTFRMLVAQGFEVVAVKDGDDWAREAHSGVGGGVCAKTGAVIGTRNDDRHSGRSEGWAQCKR